MRLQHGIGSPMEVLSTALNRNIATRSVKGAKCFVREMESTMFSRTPILPSSNLKLHFREGWRLILMFFLKPAIVLYFPGNESPLPKWIDFFFASCQSELPQRMEANPSNFRPLKFWFRSYFKSRDPVLCCPSLRSVPSDKLYQSIHFAIKFAILEFKVYPLDGGINA